MRVFGEMSTCMREDSGRSWLIDKSIVESEYISSCYIISNETRYS
jgi:hypothetical protein